MRIPVPLAWLILVLAFIAAGLLRQFHESTPRSPYVTPVVGSLLFAAIFFLLLVAAREWQRGSVKGRGVRLGSLTPLLLMLFVEKWISVTLYPVLFDWIAARGAAAAVLDAQFRAMAGVCLILVCVLVSRFSAPTARRTWRRCRPSRWPRAALATLAVVGGTYVVLGGMSLLAGTHLGLVLRQHGPLLVWILAGQAVLAFGEEVYFRGLLMSETERLAPRLGVRGAPGRRWLALVATSSLFGVEHISLAPPWSDSLRQLIFTVCLGVLLGMMVMVSANLHFAAGIHAWINWLLLGAAPHFVDAGGQPAIPSGIYIGLTLILAFVLAFLRHRRRRTPQLPIP